MADGSIHTALVSAMSTVKANSKRGANGWFSADTAGPELVSSVIITPLLAARIDALRCQVTGAGTVSHSWLALDPEQLLRIF
jgi:hypothetical protein